MIFEVSLKGDFMQANIYSDVFIKYKKGNKLLFNRSSRSLEPLLQLIESQEHRTLVLWAFKFVRELRNSIQDFFPNDERIDKAVSLCESWAKGDIKMPRAKKAILEVHAMAKETPNPIVIAKLHALGQGLSTIHVKTHAIGLLFYELTAIVLENGIDRFEGFTTKRINEYMDIVNYPPLNRSGGFLSKPMYPPVTQ